MREIDIHQVDAFTDHVFGGNPAGVVTDAHGLSVTEMANIAREMNLSETAFVLPPSSEQADIRLRFFTPAAEVKFCGHATVGTLSQLAQLKLHGLGKVGKNSVRVETNAGVLDMSVTNKANELPRITFTPPKVIMRPYYLQGKALAKALGVSSPLIQSKSTALIDEELNYLYIPTSSLKALGEQLFDFSHIREKFSDEGIVIFCLYTNETIDSTSDLHARGLATNVGVDEDPFTGSMQSGLVHAAKQNGYLPSNQRVIVTEQGHNVGRPGVATIHHDIATDTLLVSANAVRVFSTTIEM